MLKQNDPLVQEWFANVTAMKRLMACHAQQFGSEGYLPPSQGELLLLVQHKQPVSLTALAKTMQLTPGAITQLVEPLERTNFVQRVASPTDRRVTNVIMTSEGQSKVEAFKKQHSQILQYMTSALSTEEIKTMLTIQRKIITFLKESKDNDPGKE